MATTPKQPLYVRLPRDLHRGLKVQAAKRGISLQELITDWLWDRLVQTVRSPKQKGER